MTFSNVFDPISVRATLELCLKGREQNIPDHKNSNQWLVDWDDWSAGSIAKMVQKWRKKSVETDEQLEFTAYVVAYMEILHRAVIGHKSKPNPLPKAFPFYGPVFYPPTIFYREAWMRTSVVAANPFSASADHSHIQNTSPLSNPAQFLVEPVYVLSPVFDMHLGLDKCQVPGCVGIISKRGFSPAGPRSAYGISSNIKIIGMEYNCSQHNVFLNTSHEGFWKYLQPWQCGNAPYFRERSACTRELFDLITELRPRLSVGEITEHIKQLHMQYIRRLENQWLTAALSEKSKRPKRKNEELPTSFLSVSSGSSSRVNPAPSESFIRDVCEFFMDRQRREESAQYMRTLAGMAIGLDSTIKIAKKANIYIKTSGQKKMKVINVFDGGLLTGVNEDKELVICEFLGTSSYGEMIPPVREFADRCDSHNVPFRAAGQICVDRCCDFRKTLQIAIPGITVTQDLAHLKARIMDTIPKRSPYRDILSRDISDALISQKSMKKGDPPIYHPREEQESRLRSVWEKYANAAGVWTSESEAVFFRQVAHAGNGCLQNDDPHRMATTSLNENWHKRLNRLSVGRAGSITMIEGLVMDAILRHNLTVKIDNRSQSFDSPSRQFRLKAEGSHHLFLLESILRQREILTSTPQPKFLNVRPEHKIGLVPRESSSISKRYIELSSTLNTELKTNEDDDKGKDAEGDSADDDDSQIILMTSELDSTENSEGASTILKRNNSCLNDDTSLPNKVQVLCDQNILKITATPSCPSDIPQHQTLLVPEVALLSDSQPLSSELPFSPSLSFSPSSAQIQETVLPIQKCEDSQREVLPMPCPPLPLSSTLPLCSLPLPLPTSTTFSPSAAATNTSASSVFKHSRTEHTMFKLTGRNVSLELLENTVQLKSDGHWRCCALRMQDKWISTMSDTDWARACERYNNPNTPIDPQYYRKTFPYDSIRRDPNTLKKWCIEFEETCQRWRATGDSNQQGLTPWKQMHLTLPLPERPTTTSKQNRVTKVKVCSRCCKTKDGKGLGKGHQRDCCDDGFPIWKNVPYPLPPHMASLQNGQSAVSPNICLTRFREMAEALKGTCGDISLLSQEMQNVYTFEKLARLSTVSRSLEEALVIGIAAYRFDREFIEKKRNKGI